MTDSKSPPSDAARAWLRALSRTARIEREQTVTLPVLIERLAAEHPDRPAIASPEQALSYGALAARAARYARWARTQGLGRGAVVALLMPNRAEYLAAWLGLTRIGVAVALLNTQLRGAALAHAIAAAGPSLIIVDAELAPAYAAARDALPGRPQAWVLGSSVLDLGPLEPALGAVDGDALTAADGVQASIDDTALYIYTSGTTGLPKAARVTHYRVLQWSQWFAGLIDVDGADRMYDCLPLYHSVGGVVAVGATLVGGATLVLRPRFSASEFWRDLRAERCTLFQYIGELCRYLVQAPPHPDERGHALRVAVGNGLRPDVWIRFRDRFAIPHILEYYAATEGTFSLYNCEGEPGAVGRIPPYLAARLPVALLRHDPALGEPVRSADGRCVPCEPGEAGEAVGRLPQSAHARTGRFEGYADEQATRAKVLTDVFEAGDAWYRTGDLMRRDARGFYYFVDRVGDTFRWKGENVSTGEVQGLLAGIPGVVEAVVYGVTVPGAEGRAGMAALVAGPDFDLGRFATEVAARLPPYARPVFVRLLARLETTTTFKPKVHDLRQAGFDPALIADPLYCRTAASAGYSPLDEALYAAIQRGELRL